MKLSKKQEAAILKLYKTYWNAYISGDMKTFASLLHRDCQVIGSATEEVFSNKKTAVKHYSDRAAQVSGKVDFRKRKFSIRPIGNQVLVTEAAAFYVLAEGRWTFYGNLRLSTLFQEKAGKWKIVHQHGSLPDAHTEKDRQVNTDKIKAENQQLKAAVQLRTLELENKNRELEIEAAFEKVRSRTMAMRKSEELVEVINAVFDQLQLLDFIIDSASFSLNYKENPFKYWMAVPGQPYATEMEIPYKDIPFMNRMIAQANDNTGFVTDTLTRQEKDEWINHLMATSVVGQALEEKKRRMLGAPGIALSIAVVKTIALAISNYSVQPYTAEENEILHRFTVVFDQAYTRFLDLQRAEAQAREAIIEAGLEKVRSRTVAMRRSEELAEVAGAVFMQLQDLGFRIDSASVSLNYIENPFRYYMAVAGLPYPKEIEVPYADIRFMNRMIAEAKTNTGFVKTVLPFEEKNEWITHLMETTIVGQSPEERKTFMLGAPGIALSIAIVNTIALAISNYSLQPFTDEENEILRRFTVVFDQAYTRFLDLQKAEARAREERIEAGLEKVRSHSLAMCDSSELKEVVTVVLEKLEELNFNMDGAVTIAVYTEGTRDRIHWAATSHLFAEATRFRYPYFDDPIMEDFWNARESGIEYFAKAYSFEEKNNYLQKVFTLTDYKYLPDEMKHTILEKESYACSFAFAKHSGIFVDSIEGKILSEEEAEILRRFANVFEHAYVRFLDLHTSEIQARESQVQLAMERVRARTLAMQKSDELADTAAVLFKQLVGLGIEPNRLYIGIISDESGAIEYWITEEDGTKISVRFSAHKNNNASILKMYDGWVAQKKSMTIDLQGDELQQYLHYLADEWQVPFKAGFSQTRRVQTIAYFSKGFIGMASPDEQSAETTGLLERFAGVFNLTFTRFTDLKMAEAHAEQAAQDLVQLHAQKKRAEDALTELQVAQKQLVQAEKMASLGELTAGIAHEIQNPLNFVNNFSEVSKELLDEMRTALEKGDADDAKEIARDVIINLEKINHHGKRADAIVKGMLQHSRASTGSKELTDINALADEYLRLSYHGLRAKDKNFNAFMKTDFDESIGKINIVAQDIGRVLLNLFNNAFYSVNEKGKPGVANPASPYQPTVSVGTKKLADKIQIEVSDNGSGIPTDNIEKIFQPFFTTKPTGQGTGLGLSLSYDIIKAHGGEITVETKEGEGTIFILTL